MWIEVGQLTQPWFPQRSHLINRTIWGIVLALANEVLDPQDLRRLDPQVLNAVHERYYSALFRYARYKLDNTQEAEDAAAEVFLRLIEGIKSKRGPRKNVGGWLFATLANIIAEKLKERYKHKESVLPEDVKQDEPDLTSRAVLQEQLAVIRSALLQLTREQQHVLALRYGSEFSIKETAEVIGKKPNAVKALQFRALKSLREKIRWDKS
jgi:RNA polymerase sigma-70 factor (ECF subfamily)